MTNNLNEKEKYGALLQINANAFRSERFVTYFIVYYLAKFQQ